MRSKVVAVACLMVLILFPQTAAVAAGPTVSGAGSTWSQIAIDQWRADVARFGLSINYQGTGSSAGRQFFMIDQVDFAASDIPFQPDELEKLRSKGKSFQYVPVVAGGTSMMYNLRDASGRNVTNLRLSPVTVSKIFTGQIDDWNDPEIVADNRHIRMPEQPIIPVVRSDGSGTSAQFSAFIDGVEPDIWARFAREQGIPPEPTSYWPNFEGSVAQRGSDGVANYVANDSTGVGSIGYVEAGYAFQRGRPVASIRNVSGNYTQPSARSVAIALTQATLNPDLTQNLSRVYVYSDPNTYPISSYSYLITETEGFSPARGKVLGEFLLYVACAGQQQAEVLGYSPLPPNLVQAVFDGVRRIPGAPEPPPMSECDNPTIQAGSAVGATSGSSDTSSSSANASAAAAVRAEKARRAAKADADAATDELLEQGDISELRDPTREELVLAFEAMEDIPEAPILPFIGAAALIVTLVFAPFGVRRLAGIRLPKRFMKVR